jgi:hypothetical protein
MTDGAANHREPLGSRLVRPLLSVTDMRHACLAALIALAGCASLEGADDDRADLGFGSFSSPLPIVRLTTDAAADDYEAIVGRGKEVRTATSMTLTPPAIGDDPGPYPDKPLHAQVRMRGNSTRFNLKNSLDVKLEKADGKKDEVELLGLGKSDRWVLYAPYMDKTMFRNTIGMEIARELGLVAAETRHVELFVNDEYLGIYVLMQKISPDMDCDPKRPQAEGACIPDRPKTEDGGYLFARDGDPRREQGAGNPDDYFRAGQSDVAFSWVEPDEGDLKNDVANVVADVEAHLCTEHFADPIDGYAKVIDVDAFVNYFLLRELFKDVDGFRRSMYFYVNAEGKVSPGPIWDLDTGSGAIKPALLRKWQFPGRHWALDWDFPWFLEGIGIEDPERSFPWFERLMMDPAFVAKVQDRWAEMRDQILEFHAVTPASACEVAFDAPRLWKKVLRTIQPLTVGCGATTNSFEELDVPVDQLAGACPIKRNFTRWDQMGKESPSRRGKDSGTAFFDEGPAYYSERFQANCADKMPTGKTYRDTYAEIIVDWRSWMLDRMTWMDANVGALGPEVFEVSGDQTCLRYD